MAETGMKECACCLGKADVRLSMFEVALYIDLVKT